MARRKIIGASQDPSSMEVESNQTTWVSLGKLARWLPLAYVEFMVEYWEAEGHPFTTKLLPSGAVAYRKEEWEATISYYHKMNQLPSRLSFERWQRYGK